MRKVKHCASGPPGSQRHTDKNLHLANNAILRILPRTDGKLSLLIEGI